MFLLPGKKAYSKITIVKIITYYRRHLLLIISNIFGQKLLVLISNIGFLCN